MIRVFIADDHAVVRNGLRAMISAVADFEFVGEAKDGREVLAAVEHVEIDVLLLDLSLPKVSGLEVLRRLAQEKPRMRILVLSMYAEAQYAGPTRELGAAGYLSKDRPLEDVERAIRALGRGRSLPERNGVEPPSAANRAPHELFSAREYQIFFLLLQGRSNADIAAELDLVASTISNHTTSVKNKLGVHTLAEIVSYAHRMGLID